MPDIITHYLFGNRVFKALSPSVVNMVDRGTYDLATVGPDPWFLYRFLSSKKNRQPGRGTVVHLQKCGEFLSSLLKECQKASGNTRNMLFSYFAGFICHYELDRYCHPYINDLAGFDDGSDSAKAYRGCHMYLERAIDWEHLRNWPEAGDNPILQHVLCKKSLPVEIRKSYNSVHQKLFGWKNAYSDMNRCLFYQRIFYRAAWDRKGNILKLLIFVNRFVPNQEMTCLSYYNKQRNDLDVLNLAHRKWRNPWIPEEPLFESFTDLEDRAFQSAVSVLNAAWAFLQGKNQEVFEKIGNYSYRTGLDLSDSRNNHIPVCDPISIRTLPAKNNQ